MCVCVCVCVCVRVCVCICVCVSVFSAVRSGLYFLPTVAQLFVDQVSGRGGGIGGHEVCVQQLPPSELK